MRKDKPIFNHQVTARFPNDLVDRVDRLAEDRLMTRGAWVRSAVLDAVRKEEQSKTANREKND